MNRLRERLRAAWRRPGVPGGMLALFAALTLGSWALASPIGAGPDDDFHLVSTWCAGPAVDELCADGSTPQTREVPRPLLEAPCFAYDPEESAACQLGTFDWSGVGPGAAELQPILSGLKSGQADRFQARMPVCVPSSHL